jgi:hypothetical protein
MMMPKMMMKRKVFIGQSSQPPCNDEPSGSITAMVLLIASMGCWLRGGAAELDEELTMQ